MDNIAIEREMLLIFLVYYSWKPLVETAHKQLQ